MKIIRTPQSMQKFALAARAKGRTLVLVPTMGALHEGHASLIRLARARAGRKGIVIVSIYVNPTQFGPHEDFKAYPRPFAKDAALCRKLGVDLLFNPTQLYAKDHSTWVQEMQLSQGRCAKSRPEHFKGVTTVVAQLFHLTLPTMALFGQKDAQQCEVIQRMARDLHFPLKIIIAPTVREKDGLALSSRNAYLNPAERARAPRLYQVLKAAAKLGPDHCVALAANGLRHDGFELDYVEMVGKRLCAAIRLGSTRLIDNVPVV